MPGTAPLEQHDAENLPSSSGNSKTSEEWLALYSLLCKRRTAALKPGNKSSSWWKYFDIVLITDPVTSKATNVVLKCLLCKNSLSSSNPSRIADTHLTKGGCPKIKTDVEVAAEVADRLVAIWDSQPV